MLVPSLLLIAAQVILSPVNITASRGLAVLNQSHTPTRDDAKGTAEEKLIKSVPPKPGPVEIKKSEREEFQLKYDDKDGPYRNLKPDINDFEKLREILKGSGIFLVKHNHSGEIYIMKTLSRLNINAEILLNEVSMMYADDVNSSVCIVMDNFSEGDLLSKIPDRGVSEATVWFYAAELFIAIDYLHTVNCIHGDVKAENIFIDSRGHVRLADFGSSNQHKMHWIVHQGTYNYMAPEMINMTGYGKEVDWWALGVLLYLMITGGYPYKGSNVQEIYDSIRINNLAFPAGSIASPELRNFIMGLLTTDVPTRLTAEGIKKHPGFKFFDPEKVSSKQDAGPFATILPSTPTKVGTRIMLWFVKKNLLKKKTAETASENVPGTPSLI